ncbi:S41 family peptidase [Erysipelothrix sp. HDW6A]|uniref:S41 family peptidase n=1 Tax=Erysipelothrix sp. HDW6A TaxID=2714928 RepID=UPI00140E833D|nr:S41 family peptidase [Erysipelothrix sp. HDW6A]QIK56433.1 S41 family peptidase [Erysipelothrix sp. HDW6A]
MDNEKQKVQIKVERHKWADEIAKEKQKRKLITITVLAIVVSFFVGWQAKGLVNTPSILRGTSSEMERFEQVYDSVLSNWYFSKDMEDPAKEIIDNAIKGMLERNGDIHTSYMTGEEIKQFNDSINRNFVGIGVQYMQVDTLNIVTDVFKNSPAEKAGIIAGDIFSKVNGESTSAGEEVLKNILGEEGTVVEIEMIRNQEPITFSIERAEISALVSGKIIDNNVAYLNISSFGRTLSEVTEEHLKDFKAAGADSLIIDLRDNGGGYLNTIQTMVKLFLEDGQIAYQEKFSDSKTTSYTVKGSKAAEYKFKNVVVLVNENSASASEVLTLALQENIGAIVVGNTTYGKGTVQNQVEFKDSSSLKVTIAEWLGPNGDSINGVGIKPDELVLLPEIFYARFPDLGTLEIKYDTVDEGVQYAQKALSYLKFHTGRTDGYFDSATQDALQSYATSNGFNYKGVITSDVLKQLYSSVLADWAMNRTEVDNQLHKAIEVAKR